ncbi:MAG: ATP-binding cassette domain-containing protein [Desulfosalsimonas sp.]|uniref:ATP-binding cassette domain-containing protein n=1 Tax=Desulfosalsimonas sp. TaxID=3073848 RepID=UPI003970C991
MFEFLDVEYGSMLSVADLRIGDDQITSLVGVSGSGKTTVLRLLNKMISPTRGKILFQGVGLEQINPVQHRRNVVMLSQGPESTNQNFGSWLIQVRICSGNTIWKMPEKPGRKAISTCFPRARDRSLRFEGKPPFSHGVGVCSGPVLSGNTGSRNHPSYALIGDIVNTASSIQELTKEFETDVLISARLFLPMPLADSIKTQWRQIAKFC